ncbi:MAG: helix-turn-helix domain-containing protein [Bacteroidia bacterium]
MLIQPINLFYLLGVGLSWVLVVSLLLKRQDQSTAKKLLIGLLIGISTLLLQESILLGQPPQWFYYIFGAIVTSWYVVPPLLYLFVKSIVEPEFKLQRQQAFLFALPILLLLEWFLNILGVRISSAALFSDMELYSTVWILFFLLMSLGFTLAALGVIHRVERGHKQSQQLSWLRIYHYGFGAILLVSIVLLLFFMSIQQYSSNFEYWLLIFYEILVLGLVFKMLQSSSYLSTFTHRQYANAPVQSSKWEELHQHLDRVMRERALYIDGKLNLSVLAQATDISENQLSQLFNQHLNTNFYQFVNRYRLEAFAQKVNDPSHQHLKILAIAEASGFNSKANFYKVFKEKYQMTPSEFRKQS